MLKNVILKQKKDRDQLSLREYTPRQKEKDAEKWLATDLIKVILGPRRAGKSVFAFRILKNKNFAYFNFDDESLPGMEKIDTDQLLTGLIEVYGDTKYIFFDEIQNLPNWELFVNRLHRLGYNLIVTGSNAGLLSKELATHLTGRHIPLEILPFSFSEYLSAKHYVYDSNIIMLPEEKAKLLLLLTEYMTNGGYPEVALKGVEPRGYLDVLFDAILFKDVARRHNVRQPNQIDGLGTYLINNVANLYSARKLRDTLGFKSDVTVSKYLDYLIEAYILFSLDRHSTKATLRIRSPKKTYVVDNGLITAKAVQHSPDSGKLLENLVFTELVKAGNEPNRELFYYKTRNDREIDFVRKDGHMATELIQVVYDISSKATEEREVKALIEASGELGVQKLTIITWNTKKETRNGSRTIHFLPLYEWLLEAKGITHKLAQ